jgi:hypothetical protein
MTILDQFITNCNRLVATLVIKLDGIAYNMNRELLRRGYSVSSEKENWKYYLNISGNKHESNEDVYINLIEGRYSNTQDSILVKRLLSKYITYKEFETNEDLTLYSKLELETIKDVFDKYITDNDYLNTLSTATIRKLLSNKYTKLTAKVINKHKYTKQYLLEDNEYYSELTNIYPNEFLYILGSIYNIDKETAMNAENGTILGYNTSLVEDNEYNLIPSLEAYAKRFLKRYYNHKYVIVDDLYVPSIIGILYSLLLQKVINIRAENMFTNRVHSFHIEAALRSKYKLWENVSNLTSESKYWLYKNIDRIGKYIGRNSNLKEIADRLLSPNDIGIAKLQLNTDRPKLNTSKIGTDIDGSDILAYQIPTYKQYSIPDKQLHTIKINKEYPTDSIIEVKDLVKTEVDTFSLYNSNTVKGSLTVNNIVENIQDSYIVNNNEPTKVLDIKMARSFSFHGSNTLQQIMNYLAYIMDKHNKYSTDKYTPPIVEFTDPNTKLYYELTPYSVFLLIIKFVLEYLGQNTKTLTLTKYHYDEILAPLTEVSINNSDTFWNTYNNYLYQNSYDLPWLTKLHDYYPDIDQELTSILGYEVYFENLVHYLDLKYAIESNIQNHLVSTNVKQLHQLLYRSGTLTLSNTGATIDELLSTQGVTYNFGTQEDYDYMNALYYLVKTLTGIDITNEFTKEQNISNFRSILNKLTSYSVQVVNIDTDDAITGSEDKYLNIYYNRMTIAETDNSIIYFNMEKTDTNPGMNMYHILEHYSPEVSGTVDTYKTRYTPIIVNDTKIVTSWVDENVPFKITGMELSKSSTFNPLTPPNTSISITNVTN